MSVAVAAPSVNDLSPAEGELERYRACRRELRYGLAKAAAEAIAHIENGSFEMVEQALTECQDDLCEIKKTIKKTRRARKNDTSVSNQAG